MARKNKILGAIDDLIASDPDYELKRIFALHWLGNARDTFDLLVHAGYADMFTIERCRRYAKDKIVVTIIRQNLPKSGIALKNERLKFWTKIMNGGEKTQQLVVQKDGTTELVDVPLKTSDRLKASELLGKAFKDFVERHEIKAEGSVNLVNLLDPDLLEGEEAEVAPAEEPDAFLD